MTLDGVRVAVLSNYVTEGMDQTVAQAWEATLGRLARAGARLVPLRLPVLDSLPAINHYGFSPIEAYAMHRARLHMHADAYDPRVLARIRHGEGARAAAIRAARTALAGIDAFIMPTVPIVPPAIDALEADPTHFAKTNALVLRNPSVVNFLNGCAVSLPCTPQGAAPVGLSVAGLAHSDSRVLRVARSMESVLR
jgi:aspartyl-tRNA(Asn)/glutamyl-tRNA(Gln) amidotransferase subunit A